MTTALLGVVWVLVLTGIVGTRLLLGAGLYRSAVTAGLGRTTARTVAVVAVGVLLVWVAASWLLAYDDVYQSGPWGPVAFLVALAALLASTRIPVVSRVLAAPDASANLVRAQSFRVVGVLFLIMTCIGRAPALFAIPTGLGDLMVGLTAPWVARALARGTGRRAAVRFNVLGIVDYAVALVTGMVSSLVAAGSADAAVGGLPLVLIITTAGPLGAAMHIMSLRRLRVGGGQESPGVGRDPATTSPVS